MCEAFLLYNLAHIITRFSQYARITNYTVCCIFTGEDCVCKYPKDINSVTTRLFSHGAVNMGFFINLVRNLLGGIIAFFDVITRGRKLKRSADVQLQVEKELQNLSLYQFFGCPFCIKTRRAMYKMNLPINKRSVSKGSPYRQELREKGGKIQTPCLRIDEHDTTTWLYGSSEIIEYLEQRFT
jgi:glutaredoxin